MIGLTGDEHEGISGLEKQYDETLTGTPGRRVEVRDVFGRPIQVLSDSEAVEGADVRTTLDPAIQDFTEQHPRRDPRAVRGQERDGAS